MRCLVAVGLVMSALWVGAADPEPLSGLEAWADPAGVVHVRWITAAPSKGAVLWGRQAGALDQSVPEDPSCLRGTTNNRDSGEGFANNHRADFANPGAWPVFCRVTATTREGAELTSAVLTVAAPRLPASRADVGRITLEVDPGEWPFPAMPVTFGVPFPRGELGRPEDLRLLAGAAEVPVQTRVVTRWHADQSIKWLRLDAVVPRETRQIVLEYGRGVTAGAAPAAPIPAAFFDGLPGDPLVLTDTDGTARTFQVERRQDEEAGPVKVVTRFDGHFGGADGARWAASVRWHRWQGVPAGRWDVTLMNQNLAAEMTAIQSFEMRLPAAAAGEIRVGRGEATVALAEGERAFQREDSEWIHEPAGTLGKRLDGVIQMPGGMVVLRHFWEQWPAAIGRQDGRLVLGLCPRLPEGFYAGRANEDKYYYAVRDSRHTFRQGWSKTWEFWTTPTDTGAGLAGDQPVVSLPPVWIEDSGALGRLAVANRDQFTGYDETLQAIIDGFPAERERQREYGMSNFGDWYGERTWNWGNLEYDLGHAFLTQFARSGYAPFRRQADAILRHQRDVDTRHAAADPRRVGQQWIHSIGHTAGYYDNSYKDMKVYAGTGWSDNRGHIWAQGILEHYLFGGDARSWETGLLIADWAAGPQTTNFYYGLAREPGWMLKLVMSAYAASEDPFYLNAARIMADYCHRHSLESGDRGFYFHKLSTGHCNCPDDAKHSGEAGFMLATQMTGLAMYYDVSRDPVIADDIAKTARFVMDSMWEPADQAFRYTSCPYTSAGAGSTWILMHGLAFGARHAGDAELAEVCRQSLAAAWSSLPRSGKSAGYVLCNSAQALDAIAQLPGKPFRDYLRDTAAMLSSPTRRSLPTLVPNPDFEDGISGWPSRGWQVAQGTDVVHGGAAALRITGSLAKQNEYLNTTYDSSAGTPWEIRGLTPGARYRLSAWLRVDQISPGAPAPNLRLAFRDAGGTRGGAATSAYDLTRLGTWQCLTGEAVIPEWNTRNYIALNTNTREAVEVVMHLDDVHLTPVDEALPESPRLIRLEPGAAALAGAAKVAPSAQFRGDAAIQGPGAATWELPAAAAGTYTLWLRLDKGARLGRVLAGTSVVAQAVQADEAVWVRAGEVVVPAAGTTLRLERLGEVTRVGRAVLSNVPGSLPATLP